MSDEKSKERHLSQKEKKWKESFKYFDADGSGYIDESELRKAMNICGQDLTQKEIQVK